MTTPSLTGRLMKWATAGLCVVIVTAWFLSAWYVFGHDNLHWQWHCSFGSIWVRHCTWTGDDDLIVAQFAKGFGLAPSKQGFFAHKISGRYPLSTRLGFEPPKHWHDEWEKKDSPTAGGFLSVRSRTSMVLVPFYLPMVMALLATMVLWWRDRRRIPPGHCQTCGYNLTGNVSGRCPECGTIIETRRMPNRIR